MMNGLWIAFTAIFVGLLCISFFNLFALLLSLQSRVQEVRREYRWRDFETLGVRSFFRVAAYYKNRKWWLKAIGSLLVGVLSLFAMLAFLESTLGVTDYPFQTFPSLSPASPD